MKRMVYTAPKLEKLALVTSDILLSSGTSSFDERGALDDFDTVSGQYQRQIWGEFLTDFPD